MADVQQIIRVFEKKIRDSVTLKNIARKASQYPDAQKYAKKSAEILLEAIGRFVDVLDLQQDEAVAIFGAGLEANYKEVASICRRVQQRINERAGINLGVLEPKFDAARAQGIGLAITDAEQKTIDYVKNLVINNSLNVVDDAIRDNSEAQERMGLTVHITRTYDDVGLRDGTKYAEPCRWCLDREGEWTDYKEAYDAGAFQRHPGCGCVITYEVGKTRTWQNRSGGWNQM